MAHAVATHGAESMARARIDELAMESHSLAVRAEMGDDLELALIDEAKRNLSRAYKALEQLEAYQREQEDPNHDRNLEISRLLSEGVDRWEAELLAGIRESQERQEQMIREAFADLRGLVPAAQPARRNGRVPSEQIALGVQ